MALLAELEDHVLVRERLSLKAHQAQVEVAERPRLQEELEEPDASHPVRRTNPILQRLLQSRRCRFARAGCRPWSARSAPPCGAAGPSASTNASAMRSRSVRIWLASRLARSSSDCVDCAPAGVEPTTSPIADTAAASTMRRRRRTAGRDGIEASWREVGPACRPGHRGGRVTPARRAGSTCSRPRERLRSNARARRRPGPASSRAPARRAWTNATGAYHSGHTG